MACLFFQIDGEYFYKVNIMSDLITAPKMVIMSGIASHQQNLKSVLAQNGLEVVDVLPPKQEILLNLKADQIDIVLLDLSDDASFDIIEYTDQCAVPVLFDDCLEQVNDTWIKKLIHKIYESIPNGKFQPALDAMIDSPSEQSLEINYDKTQPLEQPLGELLIQSGKLNLDDLNQALSQQQSAEDAERIGQILNQQGLISEKDVALALSKQLAIPLVRPIDYPDTPILEEEISVRFLKEHQAMPLLEKNNGLIVAMVNPSDDYTKQALEMLSGQTVIPCVAVASEFNDAFETLYGSGKSIMDSIVEDMGQSDEFSEEDDVEQLKDMASEAPIIRLVSLLIHNAIEARASDIHIEPFENALKVRYRIDGVLQDVEAPPSHSCAAVISRIKIMAKLNIAERRLPQDGRIKLKVEGKEVDLRVSTAPTMHGESVVMRILVSDNVVHDFASLGFIDKPLDDFKHCLFQPHGILLVTGPTGSGKTTTLYTALNQLNTPGRKIITVEDPVEYQLEGINQIQVKPQIGLNFADALRSIVRQDPDVIMIGEMRDVETAKIAIQSALTGHMVLSTLHTNDAPSSLTRLMDMGVDDYLVTTAISGVLAQRLVRRLCEHCRQPYQASQSQIDEWKLDQLSNNSKIQLYRAVGCEQCHQTGYSGRLCVMQMMLMNEDVRRLVMQHASSSDIAVAAQKQGMDTILHDGLVKVIQGMTTLEEVLRVTQDVQA